MVLLYAMVMMGLAHRRKSAAHKIMNTKILNGGVLGYGGAFQMGRLHLGWMQEAGIRPYAACDKDAARLAVAASEFPGLRTFTDHRAMLADSALDVVVQILPHNLHGVANRDIVLAGKHCVSEKPFTLTVAEADAAIAAARENGVTLTVFHNRRWDADHLAMRAVIESGEIGEVFRVEAGMGVYGLPPDWWRADKALSGGAMYDWGVHFIDWVLRLIPDPIENVTAFYQKRVWDHVTNEDETEALIRFVTGKRASVRISSIDAAAAPKFRISGTQGAIVIEGMDARSFTVRRMEDGELIEREVHFADAGYPDPGAAFYRNLADHLQGGAPLAVTAESARRNIAVIEAAERSAASHRAEPVSGE